MRSTVLIALTISCLMSAASPAFAQDAGRMLLRRGSPLAGLSARPVQAQATPSTPGAPASRVPVDCAMTMMRVDPALDAGMRRQAPTTPAPSSRIVSVPSCREEARRGRR